MSFISLWIAILAWLILSKQVVIECICTRIHCSTRSVAEIGGNESSSDAGEGSVLNTILAITTV